LRFSTRLTQLNLCDGQTIPDNIVEPKAMNCRVNYISTSAKIALWTIMTSSLFSLGCGSKIEKSPRGAKSEERMQNGPDVFHQTSPIVDGSRSSNATPRGWKRHWSADKKCSLAFPRNADVSLEDHVAPGGLTWETQRISHESEDHRLLFRYSIGFSDGAPDTKHAQSLRLNVSLAGFDAMIRAVPDARLLAKDQISIAGLPGYELAFEDETGWTIVRFIADYDRTLWLMVKNTVGDQPDKQLVRWVCFFRPSVAFRS
jgi:hypothetical protein